MAVEQKPGDRRSQQRVAELHAAADIEAVRVGSVDDLLAKVYRGVLGLVCLGSGGPTRRFTRLAAFILAVVAAKPHRRRRDDGSVRLPGQRPLRALQKPELLGRFEAAVRAADGEGGAHCVHELWMRGEFPAHIENALEQLWSSAARSIPEWLPMRYIDWLPAAYEAAERFRAAARGRYNIYLVLLDFEDRKDGPHGVYVGMSHYTPAQRFDQHKAGIRAAGSVLKRGIEVLTGPVLHLQRISRQEAARIEGELAAALGEQGILVTGGH